MQMVHLYLFHSFPFVHSTVLYTAYSGTLTIWRGVLLPNSEASSGPSAQPHNYSGIVQGGISQGSVATHLRCGGIFSDSIITHFLLILTVNNFENRLIFDEIKAYQKNCAIFWGPPCILGHSK